MNYNPTPEKLASYGFQQDVTNKAEWRRFDGRQLVRISVYEKGFEVGISTGYPLAYGMRFTPPSEQFFDALMQAIQE